ncbi:xanthine dehydrogenase accessory factor [Thermocatellispora tengchongensis]|uniref:Xanthine dehydrogenase accessory factor n=1 Tax=Thermocatellispora tengchongensis TaxID=1073253 RepID=A0A840NU41_9ACTN|nr:XdhC family protein [Thermocatellispora tengchongensis]MBB5131088.1 xanthine dehydrogenase accessory factor [Thermocatellispora tengchongensis]
MSTDFLGMPGPRRPSPEPGSRQPYVIATVVRAARPTSAKPGDRALVLADGTIEGFVGGHCATSAVRAQSMRVLARGASTLLRITPEAAEPYEEEGLVAVGQPCLSGGTLEIFLQAVLPPALVHVYGDGPIAQALRTLGEALAYEVTLTTAPSAPIAPDTIALIVASHGVNEPPVLQAALQAGVPYIGLIASRERGAAVVSALDGGSRVHTPAGLDLRARTPAEIALSVYAEIIATRHTPAS